jgi:hypothetical protein
MQDMQLSRQKSWTYSWPTNVNKMFQLVNQWLSLTPIWTTFTAAVSRDNNKLKEKGKVMRISNSSSNQNNNFLGNTPEPRGRVHQEEGEKSRMFKVQRTGMQCTQMSYCWRPKHYPFVGSISICVLPCLFMDRRWKFFSESSFTW